MAQQLKFVACLKILMEELSTLATGFEVDGGQLRYQLYVWLEREVEALRQLCNYSSGDGEPLAPNECTFITKKNSEWCLLVCIAHSIFLQYQTKPEIRTICAIIQALLP